MSRFRVGDIIRCKKKFSHFYHITNIYALCKVTRCFEQNKYNANIRVVVIGHKYEAYVVEDDWHDVYDFHFRKATEKDKKQFLLYVL